MNGIKMLLKHKAAGGIRRLQHMVYGNTCSYTIAWKKYVSTTYRE